MARLHNFYVDSALSSLAKSLLRQCTAFNPILEEEVVMEQNRDMYLEEFPVDEEGLLLVDDLELLEALHRRAKHQEAKNATSTYAQIDVQAS